MTWWVEARQIADGDGKPTGRWRMAATSDEDGGGPFGDISHDHASREEAEACEACDAYHRGRGRCGTGFARDRAEYERLKIKYAQRETENGA